MIDDYSKTTNISFHDFGKIKKKNKQITICKIPTVFPTGTEKYVKLQWNRFVNRQ